MKWIFDATCTWMTIVKIDIFQVEKTSKLQFWATKELYISEESWEHVQHGFSKKKCKSLQKNYYFFNIFNFLDMLDDAKKFRHSIFQKFCKRNFKSGFSGTSQILRETKSPILVSLSLLL